MKLYTRSLLCMIMLTLFTIDGVIHAITETENVSDPLGAYFIKRPVPANRDVYELRVDLTGDGNDEILVSDDALYRANESPRCWIIFHHGVNHLYTGIGSGLDWNLGQPGVIANDIAGYWLPSIMIPIQGSWNGKNVMRYRTIRISPGPVKYPNAQFKWLRELLPGKSVSEYDAIYADAKTRGVDMSELKATEHNLEELARKYKIVTYDNAQNYRESAFGKNVDPGFHLLAPGLPVEGIPFVQAKGEMLWTVVNRIHKEYIAARLVNATTNDSASSTTVATPRSASNTPTKTPPPAVSSKVDDGGESDQEFPWIFVLLAAGAGLLLAIAILRRWSSR